MDFKYEVGQYVYTVVPIRGWFDYSMAGEIPANAMAVILDRANDEDGNHYLVEFLGKNQEFGTQHLAERHLKLG